MNLWPRTLALVASRKTFLWLGAAERALLLAAADRTLQRALDHLNDQEQRDLDALPARVNVVLATDEQLLRMREQVEPVYEDLRRDPETRDGTAWPQAGVATARATKRTVSRVAGMDFILLNIRS